MKPEDIEKKLFALESAKYGDKYVEHLLEQYKIYVESADKISDRRQRTNEFFLGLNTALVALLGFISSRIGEGQLALLFCFAAVGGITVCYLWYRIIRSYKGLNRGKFAVIHAIESRLPLSLFDAEWEILERGDNREVYWPFTHIELKVPWIFILIYLGLVLVTLPGESLLAFAKRVVGG